MSRHFLYLLFVIFFTSTPALMMEPTAIIDGLAVYRVGDGEPIFLMPYPHASVSASAAEGPLADILIETGRSVITFDPPGAFRSTRTPTVNLDEMLACTSETLDHFGIDERIDFIGHSMSSFCALAFNIEHQERVKRLVLVGSTSGWPAVRKWGLPRNWKWWKDWEYWQCMYLGTRIVLGLGNLAIHKKLDHLVASASYVDQKYVHEMKISREDRRESLPARSVWFDHLRKGKVDYKGKLHLLDLPVLICVGKYDPQTPVVMNRELHDGIRNSEIIIFEHSGHNPFVEEKELFTDVLRTFLEREPAAR